MATDEGLLRQLHGIFDEINRRVGQDWQLVTVDLKIHKHLEFTAGGHTETSDPPDITIRCRTVTEQKDR